MCGTPTARSSRTRRSARYSNAMVMPPAGGDTMWSNMYLAYETLAEPMKEMINGLTAIHTRGQLWAARPQGRASDRTPATPNTGRPVAVREQAVHPAHPPAQPGRVRGAGSPAHRPRFQDRLHLPLQLGRGDHRHLGQTAPPQHFAVNDFDGARAISRVTILGDHPNRHSDTARWSPTSTRRVSAARLRPRPRLRPQPIWRTPGRSRRRRPCGSVPAS